MGDDDDAQYLAPGGYVVSLQNCINEERIAGIVGWGRTVGMIAARISVDLHAPGQIRRTVPKGGKAHTVFRVGEVHGRVTQRVEQLAELVAPIDSVKVTTNLWGERWSKLCVNGMRNGVSAATGLSGNDGDRTDEIRRFAIRLGGEAVRVGQALGYELEHIGNLEPEPAGRGLRRQQGGAGGGRGHPGSPAPTRRAQRFAAPVDGPGHAEGPPHGDRVHQRLHRGKGPVRRFEDAGQCGADRHRQACVSRRDAGLAPQPDRRGAAAGLDKSGVPMISVACPGFFRTIPARPTTRHGGRDRHVTENKRRSPNFRAQTTEGPIDFHEWIGNGWAILFSHPKDFTPVCTTELGYMAGLKPEFDKRNTKIIGLSVDPVDNHQKWAKDIEETQGHAVNYPMIGDTDLKVATAYDMLPEGAGTTSEGRTAADNATVRSVFVIGPDKQIKAMLTYPMSHRAQFRRGAAPLDSIQLTAKHTVATR